MWSDERLDDLAQRMDAGFDRVDRDIRDLRASIFQLWGTTIAGILGTIATVLITNT